MPQAQGDLDERRIRVLHDQSFVDDPTRIFRAVRYEQRLGFSIEPHTLELLQAALVYVPELSGDRVRHELDHILLEETRIAILERLDRLGVLAAVDPGLTCNETMQASISRLPENLTDVELAYLAWLAHLPAGSIKQIAARLHFSAELAEAGLAASQLKNDLPDLVGATPSRLVAQLERVPQLALRAMPCIVEEVRQKELIERYMNDWSGVKAHTDGHILKARGLPPGPRYHEVLTTLRSAWLDGEVATPEEEQVLLERLLND